VRLTSLSTRHSESALGTRQKQPPTLSTWQNFVLCSALLCIGSNDWLTNQSIKSLFIQTTFDTNAEGFTRAKKSVNKISVVSRWNSLLAYYAQTTTHSPEGAEGLKKYPRDNVSIVFRGERMKLCALARRVRVEVGLSIIRCRRTWVWHWVINLNSFWSASSAKDSIFGKSEGR